MDDQREKTLLPPGVRVYLTPESRTKRHHINTLLNEAKKWDYEEISLPTLDYYDSITRGVSENLAHRTYQFHDDEGELLALRPDATAQVAKILSGRFSHEKLPGRYCYNTQNFRTFDLRRGELREFSQFGAEIIKSNRFQADTELLLFMLQQLERFGLDDFVVDLGHVNIYKSLINGVELSPHESQELRKKIHRKNSSGLESFLDHLDIPDQRKEILLVLPELYGDRNIFDRIMSYSGITDQTRSAVDYLHSIYQTLKNAGYEDWVSLDFGVVLNLDYYTGIVFEVLSPGIGKPIIGGGRYDNLYGIYGDDIPATGFAIEMDRLLPSLDIKETESQARDAWCPNPSPQSLSALENLREDHPVSVVFDQPEEGSQGLLIKKSGEIEEI